MLVKVGPRGQITIPKKLREFLNLSPGDSVTLIRQNGHLILEPVTGSIFDIIGTVPASEPLMTYDEMHQAVGEKLAREYEESVNRDKEAFPRPDPAPP